MQARIVAASRGVRWLVEGWRLFRAAPLGWLTLIFAYWLLMTMASLIPRRRGGARLDAGAAFRRLI